MKNIIKLTLTSALLASCSFIPQYSQPTVEVPSRWSAEASQTGVSIPAQWWTLYNDAVLNNLMQEALTQNLDLRAGVERINQSRAQLRIAGATLLPSADASLGASRTTTNPPGASSSTSNSYNGGLSISYDLDLFGANRATTEAARASLRGQQYEQESLKLVTLGDIAQAYFGYLVSVERARIAEENLKNSREILRIIKVRVDTGLDSNLELAQQNVAVSSSEASLATIKQQESTYRNALAVLMGHAPQTFALPETRPLAQFAVPEVALIQPSTLLERRPDIHVVEQSLLAADANIGAARAAFFPSINLGGTASVAATSFGDPATTVLALASSLSAPIFSGGRLEGGLDNANAQQRELVETYRKTVLVAFREVEDALAATKAANEREVALRTAMQEARRAYDISRKRYEVGTIDFQTLLDTQSSLLNAEDSYAQALEARLSASVDLVKALGGGWEDRIAEADPVASQPAEKVISPRPEDAPKRDEASASTAAPAAAAQAAIAETPAAEAPIVVPEPTAPVAAPAQTR